MCHIFFCEVTQTHTFPRFALQTSATSTTSGSGTTPTSTEVGGQDITRSDPVDRVDWPFPNDGFSC